MNAIDFSYPGLMDIKSPRYDSEARWNVSLGVIRTGKPWAGIEELNVAASDGDGLPDAPVTAARWQFSRTSGFEKVALTLSSPDQVTIIDAEGWRLAVPRVDAFPLPPGLWYHRLLITEQGGVEDQYLAGTTTVIPA